MNTTLSTAPHVVPTGITGVSHISIQVRDIERSLRFYRDFLGLHVTVDLQHETQRVIDGQSTKVTRRVAFLRWDDEGEAPFIVLGQLVSRDAFGRPLDLGELGVDHFAFRVTDLDPIIARAREMGIEFVKEVAQHTAQQYGYTGEGGARAVMFRDPDGTLVQVDQWL